METSSRPRRRSPGETDRQPLLVTDSWSVENITQGARAVSTPGSKEAGPRKGGSKVSFSTGELDGPTCDPFRSSAGMFSKL